jgi:hypothetical protein
LETPTAGGAAPAPAKRSLPLNGCSVTPKGLITCGVPAAAAFARFWPSASFMLLSIHWRPAIATP